MLEARHSMLQQGTPVPLGIQAHRHSYSHNSNIAQKRKPLDQAMHALGQTGMRITEKQPMVSHHLRPRHHVFATVTIASETRMYTRPTLGQMWRREKPDAAMCVQNIDVQCVCNSH